MRHRAALLYWMLLLSLLPLPTYAQGDDPTAVPQDVTFNDWTLTYDSRFYGTVRGEIRDAESQFPEGTRNWTGTPEITAWILEDGTIIQPSAAEIQVFSTERLQANAQSTLTQNKYSQLLHLLEMYDRETGAGRPAPALPNVTNASDPALLTYPLIPASSAPVFIVQGHYVVGENVRGIAYLTMLTNELVPLTNERLRYIFQGISADGSAYISANLPITAPDIPADDNELTQLYDAQAAREQIMTAADSLTLLGSRHFYPEMDNFDAMMLSIRRQTPLSADLTAEPDAETINTPQFVTLPPALDYATSFDSTFHGSGITFDYNSTFYGEIYASLIPEESLSGLPEIRHVDLFISPLGTHALLPTLDVFSTAPFEARSAPADVQADYDALIGYLSGYAETVAANQPPPTLPEFPNIEGAFESLPFITPNAYRAVFSLKPAYVVGENVWGIRYVTVPVSGDYEVAGDQLAYVFQGLTKDGTAYISAIMPLTSFALPEYSTEGDTGASAALNAERINALLAAPDTDFFPSFAELDAMLASLEIQG